MPDPCDRKNLQDHLGYDLGIVLRQAKEESLELVLEVLFSKGFTFGEILGAMGNIADRKGLDKVAGCLDELALQIDTTTGDKSHEP